MEGFHAIFQGIGDPRKSNAKKHGLNETLATLTGKSSCSLFARYPKFEFAFLSGFMELKGGPPSRGRVLRPVQRSRSGADGGGGPGDVRKDAAGGTSEQSGGDRR